MPPKDSVESRHQKLPVLISVFLEEQNEKGPINSNFQFNWYNYCSYIIDKINLVLTYEHIREVAINSAYEWISAAIAD